MPGRRQTLRMNPYEAVATLEWWANPSTCLGRFDVFVAVSATPGAWSAQAVAVNPWTVEDREGFDFLMGLDPVFTLRFTDDSTVHVRVAETQETDHFILSAELHN
jgi:hypothetical protein